MSTSKSFVLKAYTDSYTILDNVTVSDTVDIDQVSPHWTEALFNHTIREGEDFGYSLHTADYSGLDTWWVNDTARFAIDDEGIVTNVQPLPAGTTATSSIHVQYRVYQDLQA